jgi:hypothetical protein
VSFARWLRSTSEHHLLVVAQQKVGARYGAPAPPSPKGMEVFWQKVYAPAFSLLPYPVRARVAATLPGSHRQTWHIPARSRGPAV